MKKSIITSIIFLLIINIAIAEDLSDYPDFFGEYDKITLVVGDESSSLNVIAQSNVGSALRTSRPDLKISNQLSSEADTLKQNIISFGNPCVNPTTADIMNNPDTCDEDFEKGKAYIKLFKNVKFFNIVVAGYSDEGTRKAGDILSNFQDYSLKGDEFVFEFEEKSAPKKEKQETENQETEEQNIEEELEIIDSESEIKEQLDDLESLEREAGDISEQAGQTGQSGNSASNQESSEKPNFLKRFIDWIASLFS
ncbi:MAG TPA: hypothetical protein VI564_01010 [Candidatus Nanoarchaeia archaeon]|nr:hypothetical protein [Candidatus Nanoarchaeia archaeon]